MTSYPTDRAASPVTPDYDALAELFLGGESPAKHPLSARVEPKPVAPPADPPLRLAGLDGEDEEPTASATIPPRAIVDAVILGSLPVYASAWILQHARCESLRAGRPVALVRVLSGECAVDVVGLAPDAAPKRPFATLEDALAFVGAECARVLLRTGETSEHDLASHASVGAITILTGVDDPALVAAYRTIKAIHACEKPVRVATMGAPSEDARRAYDKIARAAASFLETPVEFAGNVEKIEPAPSVCLHRGVSRSSIATILDAVATEPMPPGADEPAPVAQSPVIAAPLPAQPPPLPALDTPKDNTTPPQPAESTPRPEPVPLASRVKGLAPTPLKAPRCEGVEIAVDAAGRVHLLLAESEDAHARSGVATLLAAQAWAQTNAALLATACATILGAPVDADASPAMHLFTNDPRRVRSLLDADIRLHLLAPVEIDGRRAWCVAELN